MSDPDLLLSLCAPAGYDPDSCKIASCIKAALELRDPTLALELLSLNVDPAFLRQSANYILRYAAEFGYTAVLERLAELGLDGRDASANNNSALRLAALFDKPDVVRVLAKRFNVREYLSETVLCTMFTDASMNGNLEILELVYELFDGRGNVAGGNIPVDVINYGCHVAIECGHINVLEWMRDRFKFQLDDRTVFGFCTRDPSFARAAGNGKLAMLKHLVAQLELTLDHMRDTCAFQRAAEGGISMFSNSSCPSDSMSRTSARTGKLLSGTRFARAMPTCSSCSQTWERRAEIWKGLPGRLSRPPRKGTRAR